VQRGEPGEAQPSVAVPLVEVLPGPKVSAETGLPVGITSAVGDMRFWSSWPS
jgi:hypothetical protein